MKDRWAKLNENTDFVKDSYEELRGWGRKHSSHYFKQLQLRPGISRYRRNRGYSKRAVARLTARGKQVVRKFIDLVYKFLNWGLK